MTVYAMRFVLRGLPVGSLGVGFVGMLLLLGIWQGLSMLLAINPKLVAFASMAPVHALPALGAAMADGSLAANVTSSLGRVGAGLGAATFAGVVTGLAIGVMANLRKLTHAPFQLLRMISPMAWMPIAIIAYDTWDGAIIFIISAAAVWPILFSVSGAIRRINPEWLELAANLGASRWQTLRDFLVPAVMQDLLAGMRLALGVAWIVLVPAELLGVTSGLGFAINDARDALEYGRLAAMVLTIGVIGLLLDSLLAVLLARCSWHSS